MRGRRGTYGHWAAALVAPRFMARARVVAAAFCVAGVALGDIHLVVLGDVHLRFTWQAWYSTYSLCVAGVARMALG